MPTHERAACPPRAVVCDLAARALVRIPLEALPERRRRPGPGRGEKLPAAFLKHVDEQTVVGLAAVFHAMHNSGLAETDFRDWAVLGGPCVMGRPTLAAALQKFLEEGAWGVSPHLIPHRSLHSLSGTISHALKIHGANFGVGGGSSSPGETLLVATALLSSQGLPGVWVALTGLEPDSAPNRAGQMPPGTGVCGLALALMPCRADWQGPRLTLLGGGPEISPLVHLDLAGLEALLARLDGPEGRSQPVTCPLDGGGRLELAWVGPTVRRDAAESLRPPHLSVAVETER